MHNGKSARAFRTIREAALEVGEEAHVLRFWEKQINALKPVKNAGGHRYYRPEDIVLLQAIRYFLRSGSYKIEGVQKLLNRHGVDNFVAFYRDGNLAAATPVTTPANGTLGTEQSKQLRGLLSDMSHLRQNLANSLNNRD